MTPVALLSRLRADREKANNTFKSNKYITIHDERYCAGGTKNDPYSVWVDLNFPIYVERNGKPVLVDEMKNIRIKYSTNYPQTRPTVYVPENIASVHCWGDKTLCLHSTYDPESHNLIQEITNLASLAANCPETINYNSMCKPMQHYRNWTEEGIKSGKLPTIKRSILLSDTSERSLRRFNFNI